MKYGWIIDVDHMPDTDAPEGTNLNAKGVKGPSGLTPDLEARLDAGEGAKFRMRDDDGELYYTGRIVFEDPADEAVTLQTSEHFKLPLVASIPEEGFAPLNDFGTPNAGAVHIEYRGPNGSWGLL